MEVASSQKIFLLVTGGFYDRQPEHIAKPENLNVVSNNLTKLCVASFCGPPSFTWSS